MCGRCEFWHRTGDEEDGDCAVLAVSHQRGGRVKVRMKPFLPQPESPLIDAVHQRTWDADDGYFFTETGGGEVVPAEDFSGVPRVFIDERGEKRKVWSPLRCYSWFQCSRYRAKVVADHIEIIPEIIPDAVGQLSLFGELG